MIFIDFFLLFYCFSSGQEVQRISVINNLPDLLKDTESHDECMRRVVPKVRVSSLLQGKTKELIAYLNVCYTQTW